MTSASRKRWLAWTAVTGLLLVTGCGTQLSRSEIVATNGSGTSQQSLVGALEGGVGSTGGDGGIPTSGSAGGPASTSRTSGASGSFGTSGTSGATGTTGSSGVTGTTGSSGATGTSGSGGSGSTSGGPAAGTPVAIGQVGTFSGPGGGVVGPGKSALAAWVSYTNAHGGVAGHQIKLYQADDGGDASKSASLMQGMVDTHHVVAFVGQMVVITFGATFNFASSHHVPVIGGDVSADGWYKTPYVFPQGAYIDDVFYADLKQAVGEGKRKLSIITCIESAACTYTATAYNNNGIAGKAGASVVYSAQTSVASLSYQSLCQNSKDAGADVVAVSLDGQGISRFARDCAQIGYHPQYITSATAVNDGQAADPNLNGMIISSNVFPWTSSSPAGAAAFRQAMQKYAPTATLAASSAQAWSAGELFKAAVQKIPAGKAITTASITAGVQSLGTFSNAGLSPVIHYGPGLPSQGKCSFILRLQKGKWTGLSTTPSVCGP